MASSFQFNGFSAEIDTNISKVQIRNSDRVLSELMVSDCREWLIGDNKANITLNAAIRMAHFVAKQLGLEYNTPTDLSGTTEDFDKILPGHIVAGIALLQANKGSKIDGKPGGSFVKDVMEIQDDSPDSFLKFMEESSNTDLMDEIGELLLPNLGEPESEFYQYFRRLTRLRNGLWSDKPGITNISGIRRTKGQNATWNDVLAVSWKDADGTLHCKAYTATTEPGNKSRNPTVPPQSFIVKTGYHHGQQPGGRCCRVMALNSTKEKLIFTRDDMRGINFHSGGSSCMPGSMKKHALPGGSTKSEADFRKNIALVEIFKILSNWGLDSAKASWKILTEMNDSLKVWNETNLVQISQSDDREIRIRQVMGSQSNEKTIKIADAINWTADYWIKNKKDPDALLRILKDIDPGFAAPADWNTLKPEAVANLIKPKHIYGIVEKQSRHNTGLNDVDGKPGKSYMMILAGFQPEVLKQKERAQQHLARLQELFKTEGITPAEMDYVKQIRFNSAEERKILALGNVERRRDEKAFDIEEEVKGWSIACQVVFGPEQFYEFWHYVVGQALQTGQRHWYYTLFDFESMKVSPVGKV